MSEKKPVITIDLLESELENHCVLLRYNEITGENETFGILEGERDEYLSQNVLPKMLSDLRLSYSGVSFDVLSSFMGVIATRNAYNPVLETIENATWDGTDHIAHACDVLGIPSDDSLSRKLVRQWFLQGIYLLHNTHSYSQGGDGVLVLVGAQGTGKTSFFRHIANIDAERQTVYFREGQCIDTRDKDTQRRVVTTWIPELGELETTLRTDIERLKAFITSGYDEFRLPYARQDIKQPRRANLCATCNSDKFLIDASGNRRFWVVTVPKRIERKELETINALQCWEQAAAIVGNNYNAFHLDGETIGEIEVRAAEHTKPEKYEEEVLDALERLEGCELMPITVTDWAKYNGLGRIPTKYIGRILSKHGYRESSLKRVNGAARRVRMLPCNTYAMCNMKCNM